MEINSYIDRESPFQPGKRVDSYYFKGRQESIIKILRYVNSVKNSQVQHFFLTGQKGIDKTSLAEFVRQYIEDNLGLTGVYVSNKDNSTVEGLINLIFEALLYKIPKNILTDKVKSIFGHIDSLEFKGAKINFKPTGDESHDLKDNFHFYLNKILKNINEDNGVFLVIDDINGLSESLDFVNWYKRFADTIEMDTNINLKLYVLIIGYPEKFNNLVLKEQSFGRIFHYEEIGLLNDNEVKEFFKDTLDSVNIKCGDNIIDKFTYFASGLPLLMQQIGDSAFWLENDNEIKENQIRDIVINAADEIGNKQIRPALDLISNSNFESILLKLGKFDKLKFRREDLENILNDDEILILDDFLYTMVNSGIFNTKGLNDEIYEFSNGLYPAYYKIKSYDFI